MKPPRCKVCGHEHFGAAHVLPSNRKPGQPEPKSDEPQPTVQVFFDRATYQREYMRRYRAKKAPK
jgi:hypothetical protein